MELEELQHPLISGSISAVIGLTITFGVNLVYPTNDITWALTAVGFASFFSGFFSDYQS